MPGWQAKTAKERSVILRRWHDLMFEHQEDLARLMPAEQGKPLAEAKGEVAYAASFIEWFAEEGKRIYGDTIPSHRADARIVVIKQGIGVCRHHAVELPAAMITRKAAPGAGRRMWHGGETRDIDPLFGAGHGGTGASRRSARRAAVGGHRLLICHRRGDDQQSDSAEAVLHRLHGDRQDADEAVRRHPEEDHHGTGRQRAVHRLR